MVENPEGEVAGAKVAGVGLEGAELERLLERLRAGDSKAFEALQRPIYDELRRIAGAAMRRERAGHTLQPTALVNEVYLKLVGDRGLEPENRNHFFGIAARLMDQALIHHARRRGASKRGGDALRVTLDDRAAQHGGADVEVLDLHAALEELAALDERQASIVRMRYFGGMGVPEVASALGISPATVKREWRTAKIWLYRRLRDERVERG